MKIALVTACFYPVVNGVTRMVENLGLTLKGFNHDPTVFTLGPSRPEDANSPFPIIRSPGVRLGNSGYFAARTLSAQAVFALRRMDVVHAHHPLGCLELVAKLKLDAPLVFTNHTRYDQYIPLYLPLPSPLNRLAGRWLIRLIWERRVNLADHCIAPTARLRDIMRTNGVRKPITVIPNGIYPLNRNETLSRENFGWEADNIIFVTVGRLAAEKNVGGVLRAFAAVQNRLPQIRLLIVGDGPDRENLEREADALFIREAVHFAGQQPFEKIPAYLRLANLFVTASITEVDPLTAIEAMAAGLPVVARKADWTVDCLPDAGAWIVENHEEMINALRQAIKDPNGRQQRGRAAQAFAHKKTISENARQTSRLYQRLIVHKTNFERSIK